MKIVIGSDHRGYQLKQQLQESLHDIDITWIDVGCDSQERCDYPVYAHKAIEALRTEQAQYAILLCGTGTGMAIAANRFPGIYAAVCWNKDTARLAKEHDNVNVLVLPADVLMLEQACDIVLAWKEAVFLEGRYQERLAMIDKIS